MPGAPFRASTSNPESSARVSRPEKSARVRAFFSAFSSKVFPSSTTAGGSIVSWSERIRSGSAARKLFTSANFPGLVVATKRSITGKTISAQRGDDFLLGFEQLFDALFGKFGHLFHLPSGERRRLGSALHLDEFSRAGHDKIHIHVGAAVFIVTEIQKDLAFDNADAHRGDGIFERTGGDHTALEPAAHRVGQRDVGAGDRRRARAAVGLDHVAVDPDGLFAQALQISHRAQTAADQALNLVGAAADPAARRLAADARLRRARQHAVLGGDPALAGVAQKRRHALFELGGTDHLGITPFDHYRAFRSLV